MIPIYQPYLPPSSLRYAEDAISSGWVSCIGKYAELATEQLKEILNVEHVQLLNSGTSATHLIAKALQFKHPEIHKVLVPNNCYVAAWNSFLYDRYHELIPVRASETTWNMDAEEALKQLDDYTAILVVHNVGNIIDVSKFGDAIFVEDNCEGIFGKYNNQYSGTKALASSLSFFGNKTITSGEGGALVTNDPEIYEYAKSVQGQGQSSTPYVHDRLGHNYRMSNVQAAILLGQLELLDRIISMKKRVFEKYREELPTDTIYIQEQEENTQHSNWMFGVGVKGSKFSQTKKHMNDKGIDIRQMFYPMSAHRHLKNIAAPDQEESACTLNEECFMVPSYPELTHRDQSFIINTILEYGDRHV